MSDEALRNYMDIQRGGGQGPLSGLQGQMAGPKKESGLQMVLEQYERCVEGLTEVRQRMERTLNQLGAPFVAEGEMKSASSANDDRRAPPEHLSARYAFLADILRSHLDGFRELAERLERL